MISSVTFLKDYRCYKKGRKINFIPGINFLVGDQGCGKSTLIQELVAGSLPEKSSDRTIKIEASLCNVKSFDFEKDNPRTIGDTRLIRGDFGTSIAARFISHGEFNIKFHGTMEDKENEGTVFLLDEPETGLSPRSCKKLLGHFLAAVKNKCQIVAAVHNPILIESVEKVLSLEHKRWMRSKQFLETHLR